MPVLNPINKLESLISNATSLQGATKDSSEFKKWYRATELAIDNIFGSDSKHLSEFGRIRFSVRYVMTGTSDNEFKKAYLQGINNSITLLHSFIDEINEYGIPKKAGTEPSAKIQSIDLIFNLIKNFQKVARQLQSRHADRPTISISDEYDVQDLFHALLKIHFDDIRAEEYTPSYAGAASRVDFILKKEKIVIELKKARPSLKAKEIGEQLIVDSIRYQTHPDCETIICFVYDPDNFIGNPVGIENDLSKEINGTPIHVIIMPK